METRYFKLSEIATRSDSNGPVLEGYFARYDDVYRVAENATESIARGAFTEAIKGDVRALYNHNHDLLLGRTAAGTLELRDTEVGLWGAIQINPRDTQAMDAYERVLRGDISGCSFGFDIPADGEEMILKDDGSVHWIIRKVMPLYEVSPCVFPAYEATSISARAKALEVIRSKRLSAWKEEMKGRLSKWH
jgi:hypothetical protein